MVRFVTSYDRGECTIYALGLFIRFVPVDVSISNRSMFEESIHVAGCVVAISALDPKII